jgi:hypothetical protein
MRNAYRILVANLEGKRPTEDPSVDGMIILKQVLGVWKVWNEFMLLRREIGGGPRQHHHEPPICDNRKGISLLGGRVLTCEEGLSYTAYKMFHSQGTIFHLSMTSRGKVRLIRLSAFVARSVSH